MSNNNKTFTYPEIRSFVLQDNPDMTDEEIEASIHILLHLGKLRKYSRDIYQLVT